MNCYLPKNFIDAIQFEQIVLPVLMNCITFIDKCTFDITLDKTGSLEIPTIVNIQRVYGYDQIFFIYFNVIEKDKSFL